MNGEASIPAAVLAFDRASGWREVTDAVASEEPLEIRVDTRPVSVTMRTPGHDEELAAGFLVTEGVLRSGTEIARFHRHPRSASGSVLDVQLQPEVRVDLGRLTRHVFAASSCGLCGKAAIEAVRGMHPPVEDDFVVEAEWLLGLPGRMREVQAAFEATGGLHAAALFGAVDGGLRVLREDVGRHNAVDKVVGHEAMAGRLPARQTVLMVSGRLSFEILQKALAAGIALVAAVSAPSSLAVEFARDSGQTLVGFLRDERFNVYAGGHRIGGCGPSPGK